MNTLDAAMFKDRSISRARCNRIWRVIEMATEFIPCETCTGFGQIEDCENDNEPMDCPECLGLGESRDPHITGEFDDYVASLRA